MTSSTSCTHVRVLENQLSLSDNATYVAVSRAHRACRGPDRVHPTRANVTDQHVQSATSDKAGERSYLPTPSSPRLATRKPRGARVLHRLTATVLLARRRRATSLPRIAHVHRRGASRLRRLRSATLGRELRPRDHATTCNDMVPVGATPRKRSPSNLALRPTAHPFHTAGHRRVSPAQTSSCTADGIGSGSATCRAVVR